MSDLRKARKLLLNFPLGIFLGTIFTLLFIWLLDSQFSQSIESVIPSLFGAFAALIAATLALAGVLTNITNQNDLAERQRLARLGSARAVLPLTLSRIHDVCLLGFKVASEIGTLSDDLELARARFNTLSISADDLKTLKECIEVADQNSATWLSLIIAHFQLQVARLEHHLFDRDFFVGPDQAARQAADWALIQGFVDHLFTFSRTSIPADVHLSRDAIHIPYGFSSLSGEEYKISNAIGDFRNYFDGNGGWSAEAFLKRLMP